MSSAPNDPNTASHGRLTPLLRFAARAPLLRRVRATVAVSRFVEAHYRAQAVEQVWKYVLLELLTRRTARYTPRGNTVDVFLRHRTSDGNIAQEVNSFRLYDPPAEIEGVLASRTPLRVLDLDAHVGLFDARILSLYPRAEVTALEASASNYHILERTASHESRLRIVHAAASTRSGLGRFASDYAESRLDANGPETVELVDVFPLFDDADLVKIDIEGGEWEILRDPRSEKSRPRSSCSSGTRTALRPTLAPRRHASLRVSAT
jgi:FkbM family methyltransferase